MDWKLIFVIYCYYFRILQAATVSMADKYSIVINIFKDTRSLCINKFGGAKTLCGGCIHESYFHEIRPTQLLFVSLRFTGGAKTFNITIQTQKENTAASRDAFTETRSFDSLSINFTLEVPEDHRYVKVTLVGVECERIFDAVNIYYYSVPQKNYLLTVFPASPVPSQSGERITVDGQCVTNTVENLKKPTMTVFSNGTVLREGLCECKPGFQLNGSICAGRSLISVLFR